MAEYSNENRGSVWKNDRKESDKHPDFTGTINVEGVEYYLNAWKKREDANPKAPLLSFTVKKKEPRQDAPQRSSKPAGGSLKDIDDDIPW